MSKSWLNLISVLRPSFMVFFTVTWQALASHFTVYGGASEHWDKLNRLLCCCALQGWPGFHPLTRLMSSRCVVSPTHTCSVNDTIMRFFCFYFYWAYTGQVRHKLSTKAGGVEIGPFREKLGTLKISLFLHYNTTKIQHKLFFKMSLLF